MNYGNGLEPMALLQAYRSGQPLPLLTDLGRPAQFLPPSLPNFDYNAQFMASRPAPSPLPNVYTGLNGNISGTSGDAWAAGDGIGASSESAPAGVASDATGGDGGGGGGGK